jgi:hypothetical protein
MKEKLKKIIRKLAPLAFLDPEGDAGIAKKGHRGYVGGLWEEIGQLQFDFLLSRGLKPSSYLIDIACGSLRLGVKAIPYLDCSHYLGIEKEPGLVAAGLEKELDPKVKEEKQPVIIVNRAFEFEKLGHKGDFAIAHALFTQLPPRLINLCFKEIWRALNNDGVFYATYHETKQKIKNPSRPHDQGRFVYTQTEMCAFGENNGFVSHYIGDWGHPRRQVMMEYRKELRCSR